MTYVYIRRIKDGMLLDIPERDLEMTLKRGEFELVSEAETSATGEVELPPIPAFECPLCGIELNNTEELQAHKSTHV